MGGRIERGDALSLPATSLGKLSLRLETAGMRVVVVMFRIAPTRGVGARRGCVE